MARLPTRRRTPTRLTNDVLSYLASRHEPAASSSSLTYRMATCVICSRRMIRMWHAWLHDDQLAKEVHVCRRCARDYQ